MADIALDIPGFRAQFPGFANTSTYPDVALDGYFSFATAYISATPYAGIGGMNLAQQTVALNLMTAHLATIGQRVATYGANSGKASGFVTSETVKDVSFTVKAFETKSAFGQWLSQTPYGQQLWALLSVASVGGFYTGGLPEGRAIRKFGGFF